MARHKQGKGGRLGPEACLHPVVLYEAFGQGGECGIDTRPATPAGSYVEEKLNLTSPPNTCYAHYCSKIHASHTMPAPRGAKYSQTPTPPGVVSTKPELQEEPICRL